MAVGRPRYLLDEYVAARWSVSMVAAELAARELTPDGEEQLSEVFLSGKAGNVELTRVDRGLEFREREQTSL